MHKEKIVVGIDLGTSTSEIAYLRNGKPVVFENFDNEKIIPSVVQITDENELIVGTLAKNKLINTNEKGIIAEIKRKMGSPQPIEVRNEKYLPQEISAMILKYLKSFVEEKGYEIEEAVITVPAMFHHLQRQATKDAANIAGIKVERIISEPTAAALAYGINNMEKNENILVYDLGGGTFDVSILEMFDGIIEVKTSRGDNELGGQDFDNRIIGYIVDELYRKYEIDIRKYSDMYGSLKQKAEIAKIELSSQTETKIVFETFNLPSELIQQDINYSLEISLSRDVFNELTKDLVDRTVYWMEEALRGCGLRECDIDTVILVGGSTRMPCIQQVLREKFGSKIKEGINPDEVVAMGAAIQAGIKAGQYDTSKELLPTDVCPYTLGTSIMTDVHGMLMPGIFDVLIPIDTPIPVTERKIYSTVYDNQESVIVEVYQGTNKKAGEYYSYKAKNNLFIGEFELKGIPPAPAGQECIEVAFTYNLNGMLEVKAKVLSTGKEVGQVFNMRTMLPEQITAAKDRLDYLWRRTRYYKENAEFVKKETDMVSQSTVVPTGAQTSQIKWNYESMTPDIKILVERAEAKLSHVSAHDKARIITILEKLNSALNSNDHSLISKYEDELTDMLFELDF